MTNSERTLPPAKLDVGGSHLSPGIEFVIPPCRSVFASAAGRWLAAVTRDRLRAEFLVLLTIVGGIFFLLSAAHLSWIYYGDLQAFSALEPAGIFVAAAVTIGTVLLVLCIPGTQPGINVSILKSSIRLSQNGRDLSVPFADIEDVSEIDALVYHRHFRRYRQTRIFANSTGHSVVLMKTRRGPVIVGLDGEALKRFLREIARALESTRHFG